MRHISSFLATLALASSGVYAGVLKVEINGATWQPGVTPGSPPLSATVTFTGSTTEPDVTITFPNQVTTPVKIRIFDSATVDTITTYSVGGSPNPTLPTLGIGKLKIIGTASTAARIDLLIADGDFTLFPPTATAAQTYLPGLASFGGRSSGVTTNSSEGQAHDFDSYPIASGANQTVYATNPFTGYDIDPATGIHQLDPALIGLIITDPSLRRQTVLVAVVNGDICPDFNATGPKGETHYAKGRIEVGQIVRLAATRTDVTGTILGGNINAYVVADSMDNFLSYDLCGTGVLTTGFRAIENVSAGNAIHGSINAYGRARDDVAWGSSVIPTQGRLFERAPAHDTDPPTSVLFFDSGEPVQFCGASQIPWTNYPVWINRGSVVNVRLGPSEDAEGIYGDIVSSLGRIFSIRSTGEILASQISAADGVLEVRVHKWGQALAANQTALPKNLSVGTISAGDDVSVQKLGNDTGDGYTATLAKARNQGCIHLIETKGAFSGIVTCDNMIDAGDGSQQDSLHRSGVIVWDYPDQPRAEPVFGPSITVRHLAHNVCMLAPTFSQITVGWQFKGTIDAFGYKRYGPDEVLSAASLSPLTGGSFPNGLNIGTDAIRPDAVAQDRYRGMVPGFVGGYRPPVDLNPSISGGAVDPTLPPQIFDDRFPTAYVNHAGDHLGSGTEPTINHVHAMLWDPDRYLWVAPVGGAGYPSEYGLDEGSLDSVIRAENDIPTKSQIFAMHQRIFEDGEPKHTVVSWYRPRIESPGIQQLGIPDIHPLPPEAAYYRYAGIFEGVIWSGAVEYWPFSPYAVWDWHGSIRKRYTDIKSNAMVQRVGPGGDVWGRGLSLAVVRDMCGELHTTSIDQGDAATPSHGIDIGSRLGDITTWPYPHFTNAHDTGGVQDPARPSLEHTPRDRAWIGPSEFEADVAPRGAVYVGLFEHQVVDSEPFDPLLYNNESRLEKTAGVLVNTSYVNDHANPLSLWDPLIPGSPVYSNPAVAWTGFVRVGDPWIDPAGRIYTLGKSGGIGTTPLPDTTWDVIDDTGYTNPVTGGTGYINEYRRHSWDLSGLLDHYENRLGGGVGVFPYHLHIDDSSPPVISYTHSPSYDLNLPSNYTVLPTWQWVHNWPPLNSIIGGPVDPVFGGEGLPRVRLRFYGPVVSTNAGPGSDVPVRIEKWDWASSSWVWFDPSQPDYFFDYAANDLLGGNGGQPYDVYLGPKCNAEVINGRYRVMLHPAITPAGETTPNNRLACATFTYGVGTYEPEPFVWYITLFNNCPDVGVAGGLPGSDGLLDNNDFIAFITLFFNQDPRADFGSAGGVPGSDGHWDNNDWIVFINLFFEGQNPEEGHEGDLSLHCETVFTNCFGFAPRGGPGGEGGGQENRMMSGGGENSGGDAPPNDTLTDIREILQLMIDNETDPARRDQLQQMLNTLPPAP